MLRGTALGLNKRSVSHGVSIVSCTAQELVGWKGAKEKTPVGVTLVLRRATNKGPWPLLLRERNERLVLQKVSPLVLRASPLASLLLSRSQEATDADAATGALSGDIVLELINGSAARTKEEAFQLLHRGEMAQLQFRLCSPAGSCATGKRRAAVRDGVQAVAGEGPDDGVVPVEVEEDDPQDFDRGEEDEPRLATEAAAEKAQPRSFSSMSDAEQQKLIEAAVNTLLGAGGAAGCVGAVAAKKPARRERPKQPLADSAAVAAKLLKAKPARTRSAPPPETDAALAAATAPAVEVGTKAVAGKGTGQRARSVRAAPQNSPPLATDPPEEPQTMNL